MATTHLRKPILFSGAVWASLATLGVELSAQLRPTPERPLSDAMAEALQSPFHGDRAPPGSPGHDFLLSSTAPPRELSGRVGAAASPSPQPLDARIPAPVGAPSAEDGTFSRGDVFLLTTLTAAVGHALSLYWSVWCTDVVTPLGGPAAPFANPAAATKGGALCAPGKGTALFLTGGLATVMMTGGVATLAGRDFWRSLAGSAVGYAGGLVAAAALAAAAGLELPCERCGESSGNAFVMGGLILGHSALTTLLFD